MKYEQSGQDCAAVGVIETGALVSVAGNTGEAGVPQTGVAGVGLVILVVLYLVLRGSFGSQSGEQSLDYRTPPGSEYNPGEQQGGPGQSLTGQSRQQSRASKAGPNSDRGVSALTHVLGFFFWIFGPILIYLISTDPFVKQNAANATNWQAILFVYAILSGLLIPAAGIVVLAVLVVINIVFTLIATYNAANGEAWAYPAAPEIV